MNRLLGTGLSAPEVRDLLARADFPTRAEDPEGRVLVAAVPSWRGDVTLPVDLVEEVARVFGYDRIPTRLPRAELRPVERPRRQELVEGARASLAAQGLIEILSFPFLSPGEIEALGLPAADARRRLVRLANPLVADEDALRTSLVPSLLRAARQNLARQVDAVRVFEIGPVFLGGGGEGGLPAEPLIVAGLLTQGEAPRLWEPRERIPPFFLARGLAERVLFELGYAAWCRPEAGGGPEPYHHPGAATRLGVGDRVIGSCGELHPEAAARFGIEAPCAVFEIDLGALAALEPEPRRFREPSRQPAVRRDLAVLLDRAQPAGEVLEAIRRTAGPQLVSVEIFDRYEGKGVPEGKRSLAFRLVFQREDRALQDAEVVELTDRVVAMLAERFGGQLR